MPNNKVVVICNVCEEAQHPLDVDDPEIWEVSWEDYCWLKQCHEYYTSPKMYGRRSASYEELEAVLGRSKRVEPKFHIEAPLSVDGVFRIETTLNT